MSFKIPTIIGHRGAPTYAPENTLDSIKTAADMGVSWVSLDVKLTKDSVPVLFHDDDMERTTNGSGDIANLTFDDVRALEAGSNFSEGFSGVKIPTLEEAIDILLEHDMGVAVHLVPSTGRSKDTAEAALDVLSQIWDDHHRIMISSFDYVALEAAMSMAPEWRRVLMLESEWPENWKDMADYLDVKIIGVDGPSISRNLVEDIIDCELGILAYGVQDAQLAKQLRSWGVDGVYTDDPDAVPPSLFELH